MDHMKSRFSPVMTVGEYFSQPVHPSLTREFRKRPSRVFWGAICKRSNENFKKYHAS